MRRLGNWQWQNSRLMLPVLSIVDPYPIYTDLRELIANTIRLNMLRNQSRVDSVSYATGYG